MGDTMEMNVIENTELIETASKGKGVTKAIAGGIVFGGIVTALIWKKIKKAKMKKAANNATEVVEGEIVEENK